MINKNNKIEKSAPRTPPKSDSKRAIKIRIKMITSNFNIRSSKSVDFFDW